MHITMLNQHHLHLPQQSGTDLWLPLSCNPAIMFRYHCSKDWYDRFSAPAFGARFSRKLSSYLAPKLNGQVVFFFFRSAHHPAAPIVLGTFAHHSKSTSPASKPLQTYILPTDFVLDCQTAGYNEAAGRRRCYSPKMHAVKLKVSQRAAVFFQISKYFPSTVGCLQEVG